MDAGERGQGRLLFRLSMILLLVFFIAAVCIAAAGYTPYAVYLGIVSIVRRTLWTVLIPASVFLPLACLCSNILVGRLGVMSVISVFLFAVPSALSPFILRIQTSGYIMLGCIFAAGGIMLYTVSADLAAVKKRDGRLSVVFGILSVLLTGAITLRMLRIVAGGTLMQIKLLYAAPLCIAASAAMSLWRAFSGNKRRHLTFVNPVWNTAAALYCALCGIDRWAVYVLSALTLCIFIFNTVLFLKYYILGEHK